jgi:hypothetical protein
LYFEKNPSRHIVSQFTIMLTIRATYLINVRFVIEVEASRRLKSVVVIALMHDRPVDATDEGNELLYIASTMNRILCDSPASQS